MLLIRHVKFSYQRKSNFFMEIFYFFANFVSRLQLMNTLIHHKRQTLNNNKNEKEKK